VLDLHEWEPWEPARIQYRNQAEVEWLIRIRGDDPRVIRTVTELDAVITESAEPRLVTSARISSTRPDAGGKRCSTDISRCYLVLCFGRGGRA